MIASELQTDKPSLDAEQDESTRLLLPADAPLLANLSALWQIDASLAKALEAGLCDTPDYAVEISRTGEPTLRRQAGDGRAIYLHSRYQPIDEAARLVSNLDVAGKMTFYVLGMGLGYHVEALFERASDEAMLWVFEPDAQMLWTAFCHRDYSKLILSGRVTFVTEVEKSPIFARLTPHAALVSLGWETLSHAPSEQLHAPTFALYRTWIDEFASYTRTSMNTLVLNSTRTVENIAANIGHYVASGSLARLRRRHENKPAVIVSAGPSLRKNKYLLKGLTDKAVMIAVQTTLKPLVEMGIEPQFVTSLDYHEICTRFFENLPGTLSTELVAEPKATTRILDMNPGPVTMLGNDFADGLVREMAVDKPRLPAGATVAHLAYYLAEYLGCNPIILVGQDLAFSDGLCYTPGTSYDDVWRPELSRYCSVEMKQWEQVIRERSILRRVPASGGGSVYTEERLFMYLQQFERDFGASKTTIIDATEGGALKRGTIAMPLEEAIERYCKTNLKQGPSDYGQMDWSQVPRIIECLQTRRVEAGEIAEISRSTLPLLQEIAEHLEDQGRVNRAISAIDVLRAKMDRLGRTYDMVMQLSQQTEIKRFEQDRKVAASKASGTERQRMQVLRDIDNVKAVIEAATAFETLMDKTTNQLACRQAEIGARA